MKPSDVALFESIETALEGAPTPGPLKLSGAPGLPWIYDVGSFATATIAAATAGVAAVLAARTGEPPRAVHVDRGHAAAAFVCERYLSAEGWALPPVWDPIAGDYLAEDGWIRLHTNYRHHRDAVLRVLGASETRDAVALAVRAWSAESLESAVVEAGGCAARLRDAAQWAAHPQGAAVSREPLFAVTTRPAATSSTGGLAATSSAGGLAAMSSTGGLAATLPGGSEAPLAGVRVLDLTRVMAGPVCTRLLAAYGADVLRLDPPGFDEVGALLPEMTAGKRRAFLDLRQAADRAVFERLVTGAHVLVHGYRADALDRLGFDAARRRELNPSLIDVSHDAYGWTGPWAHRRGFDSLVQMSCGIAEAGRRATGADRPVPLPAQALDHGCGYLLAAATCRALVRLLVDRRASEVRLSLARTAKLLVDLGEPGDSGDVRRGQAGGREDKHETEREIEPWRETAATAWGPIRRVRCPGRIDGIAPQWSIPPGPLGADAPAWS